MPKHSPQEIRAKLRIATAERKRGATVAEACRKAQISPSTYRRWIRQSENGPIAARRGRRPATAKPRKPKGFVPSFQRLRVQLSALKVAGGVRHAISFARACSEAVQNRLLEAVQDVVVQMPETREIRHADPKTRCKAIIHGAATKAATTSGSLGLPGPMAIVTILPDLVLVWKIQAQMVADIAGVFGKSGALTREHLLFCLFKHATSQIVRDAAVRAAERLLLRRGSVRLVRHAIGRFTLSIAGALGSAAYAYYDTVQVGNTAVALFEVELQAT